MKNKKKKKKKGFTLIELLAVIIILGILMIIAIPSVTEYIGDSRRKAYITTAGQYVNGARNKVNSLEYSFLDEDTTYYVPIKCIPLEKGGESPFGEWRDAYVIVTYNGRDGYSYYWTSLDSSGYKVEITNVDDLNVDSLVPNNNILNNRIGIDGRKWISIVDENTCEVGFTVEAEENYGNQLFANVVNIGDFVNYDAGTWTNTVAKPTSGYSFGGYTSGNSRNNTVNCSSERNLYNGWRVLAVENDIVTLIHAGSSECFYLPNATDSGCIGRYLLTGESTPQYGNCTNPAVFNGYTPRDFKEYMNQYASSVSSLAFPRDPIAARGESIDYANMDEFVSANPGYSWVRDGGFEDCTTFHINSFDDLFDNGGKKYYWMAFGGRNKMYNDMKVFSCKLVGEEGYYLWISLMSEATATSKGVRPIITLKANVKTTGQVEQVVGTNGATKAMVWQLTD